jgi:hypothetical protein
MPHTLAALSVGDVTEWQATLVVKATAVLDGQDRREVDTPPHRTARAVG